MELSELKSPPVPATYERGGKVLINMMVDADLLTPDFLEGVANISKVEGDSTIASTVSQINFFVRVLKDAIKAWDLTEKGVTVPVEESFFRGQPILFLADLFESCMNAGTDDKKKREQQSAATT